MRVALQRLRATIRAAAPDAEEVVSYRIPAFRQNGILVWYAAFEGHCSLFVGSTTHLPDLSREMEPFQVGKGTLQFTPGRPIPAALVTRIVRARLQHNLSLNRSKKRKAPTTPKVRQRARPRSGA
jgi:uncharacterized protein YdhG (YjbR/CyaY superfamily)